MNKLIVAGLAALAAIGVFAASPEQHEKVKVILDSDMIEDYDDMGALAILHAMADAGEAEILATISCTRANGSVAALEICNRYYGRPDIPVGCARERGVSGCPEQHAKFLALQKKYPGWFKYANSDDAPAAVDVYRRVLAAQEDGSVVICSLGFLTNLRMLLESKPDQYSPLGGRDLVKAKVKKWVAMALFYPEGHEYNSDGDGESSRIALKDWPTPTIITDFQYGRHLYAGRAIVESDYENNPVKDVFAADLLPRKDVNPRSWDQLAGHPSWDESAVLIAVRGEHSYFSVERGFYEMLDDRGHCIWRHDPTSSSGRVEPKFTREEVGRIIDELMLRKPALASPAR